MDVKHCHFERQPEVAHNGINMPEVILQHELNWSLLVYVANTNLLSLLAQQQQRSEQ